MKKLLLILILFCHGFLQSEEGMWLFNALPKDKIYKEYGIHLDEKWVNHVQKSCLRISFGGSGSFISPQGLVMTNHHVGSKAIFNLSTDAHNLAAEGFYAKDYENELKCLGMYVDQLISIQDVTKQIQTYLTKEMTPSEKEIARKKAAALIKKRWLKRTGLQPEIVTLYQGAHYHLYLYKRYTDVRLVMCPEDCVATFGGDIDNFEYPRHCFDVCFFRVYEDDKPLITEHYLKWSPSGPQLNEPLFVTGHPGSTDRILTTAHLTFQRDIEVPLIYNFLNERLIRLKNFSQINSENQRIASQDIHKIENFLKVYLNVYQGLLNRPIIENKNAFEMQLFSEINGHDRQAWRDLSATIENLKNYYPAFFVLEGIGSRHSKLFGWAKHLVRLAHESKKNDAERLKEYTASELPALENALLFIEPFYFELEKLFLLDGLERIHKVLGENHPAIIRAFEGKTVEEKVNELMSMTKVSDLNFRNYLYTHLNEIETSNDPLLLFVKKLDPLAREIRLKYENEFVGAKKESYEKIVKTLFNQYPDSFYPDATFTLRLSYGSMKGYEENNEFILPQTKREDVFVKAEKHDFKSPYRLPETWIRKKNGLSKEVPYNFVSTNDIVGGNSGSPVVNKQGEVVGIVFDGNKSSILWRYGFEQETGRAISVHSQAIIDTLSRVYEANRLVSEIVIDGNRKAD